MSSSNRTGVEVVRFDRVSLEYNGQPVFYDINFSFQTGGFYFLTGQSGAGKTSLLKLIYREIRPTQGFVRVFGRDISNLTNNELPDFRQRMGLVFQDCQLLDHLTTLDNVALSLKISGMNTESARSYAEELLAWVGLIEKRFSKPTELSDGQKQRVAIARAIITRPLLLLADEPTGSVDDEIGFSIMHLLEELNKIGTTIIVATHNKAIVKSFPFPELNLEQGVLNVYYPQETDKSKSMSA